MTWWRYPLSTLYIDLAHTHSLRGSIFNEQRAKQRMLASSPSLIIFSSALPLAWLMLMCIDLNKLSTNVVQKRWQCGPYNWLLASPKREETRNVNRRMACKRSWQDWENAFNGWIIFVFWLCVFNMTATGGVMACSNIPIGKKCIVSYIFGLW